MDAGVTVGMGEIRVVRGPTKGASSVLVGLGLGSCIGICAFDRAAGVAGMAHVVLPECRSERDRSPGKYADSAVPALVEAMVQAGAARSRMRVAIVGGAQLFAGQGPSALNIGPRNTKAVIQAIGQSGLVLCAQDVGGSAGRTVYLSSQDGSVSVRTLGAAERRLVVLA